MNSGNELNFNDLKDNLRRRLVLPLPGALAHQSMRAVPVGSSVPNFEFNFPPKRGSVLILIYNDNGLFKFPLIKRPEYLGAHSGQISFPGGKAELDEDYIQTALREGEEEIGIRRESVTVLGRLSDFFVIPSNFMVTPVVGTIEQKPVYQPDLREVARILEGTLQDVLPNTAVKQKEILAANRFRMMAPHFEIDGEVVWGATAMILNEFRIILQEIFSPPD